MEKSPQPPVFVHSLFRAGSTYMFNAFRRAAGDYWCYQEPLNEKLVHNARREGGFLVGSEQARQHLRHPQMEKPHCYEFHPVTEDVVSLFRPGFSYDHYFFADDDARQALIRYFRALQSGAQGRPVFQCCRTAGRVALLRAEMGGAHVFLERNPWDQWWSYRSDPYFNSRNLFIAGAPGTPHFLEGLKPDIGIPPLKDVPVSGRENYFINRRLNPAGSYTLFYSLWCHAVMEALPHCDLNLDMDQLAASETYQDWAAGALEELGIPGLSFRDCELPRAVYGETEVAFFTDIEKVVHERLLASRRNAAVVDVLAERTEQRIRQAAALRETADPVLMRDAVRARQQVLHVERELADMQARLFNTRAQAQSFQARASAAEQRLKQLEGDARREGSGTRH
ncbi:MAG: hypothetical protein P1U64_09910 [Alcanivoracaceae bacterium]|nr:hypothetical protein [Alcanivoracaceae bacterium]